MAIPLAKPTDRPFAEIPVVEFVAEARLPTPGFRQRIWIDTAPDQVGDRIAGLVRLE